MKFPSRLKYYLHITAPVLLALLLTIALPGAVLASTPPQQPPPQQPPPQQPPPQQPPPQQPPTQQSAPQQPPTQQSAPQQPPPQQPPTQQPAAHPEAPSAPSSDCIVAHAATPAQLCPVAGGLQFYFIGADGSSQTGPYLSPFSDLATLYTSGASVSLYTGTNPLTGKSVQIDYLSTEAEIRVSTYYPDTQYDTDKPYVFTVDSNNSVAHESW